MQIRRVPKWVWWTVAAFIILQIYFFQELIAAELLFGLAFGGLLLIIYGIYVLSEIGDLSVGWLEMTTKGFSHRAKRQWVRVEAISRKTFRHPHSASAR